MPADKLTCMRLAGKVNRDAINYGFQKAVPGKTLIEIDHEIENFIIQSNCKPAFKGYRGFRHASCLSVNDNIIHGVPNNYILKIGDILTIDVGVDRDGWKVDAADTQIIQDANTDLSLVDFHIQRELIMAINDILESELNVLKHNCSLMDIVNAAESTAKKWHIKIYNQFGGHAIGTSIHEEPFIPNIINKNASQLKQNIEKYKYQNYKLQTGQTICLEPVGTFGITDFFIDIDGWTVKSKDGSLSAHVEKCVLILENGHEILS